MRTIFFYKCHALSSSFCCMCVRFPQYNCHPAFCDKHISNKLVLWLMIEAGNPDNWCSQNCPKYKQSWGGKFWLCASCFQNIIVILLSAMSTFQTNSIICFQDNLSCHNHSTPIILPWVFLPCSPSQMTIWMHYLPEDPHIKKEGLKYRWITFVISPCADF